MNISDSLDVLSDSVESLQTEIDNVDSSFTDTGNGLDNMWLLIAGSLVFFMQAGFAMLEAGTVQSKNTVNILFKNLIDGAISVICFWLFGYAFAYGNTADGFIGQTKFGLASDEFDLGDGSSQLDFQSFFFQWTFAATAATIVSGSVAERCKLEAYFCYSAVITTFIYPVIVHWGWGAGWLSAFGPDVQEYLLYGRKSNNFIDFAGSGIVHAVGGLSGLIGALYLGPREGRFYRDNAGKMQVKPMTGHSIPLVVLGTIILWVGWYGFNAGSTLCIVGDCAKLAAKVAVVTTIAAASSALTMVGLQTFVFGKYDITLVCNSLLAGLVSVTAPCAVVDLWAAMLIGISGCFVYIASSKILLYIQIDDPLDAFPIHGACGIWGVVSVGIFGNDENAAFAGYNGSARNFHPFRTGEQFAVQIVGILCIIVWTVSAATVLFLLIEITIGLRVEKHVEEEGLDSSEHGVVAYIGSMKPIQYQSQLADKREEVDKSKSKASNDTDADGIRKEESYDDDDDDDDVRFPDQADLGPLTMSRKKSSFSYAHTYPEKDDGLVAGGDIRGIPLSPLTQSQRGNSSPMRGFLRTKTNSGVGDKYIITEDEQPPQVMDKQKSVEDAFYSPLDNSNSNEDI